MDNSAATGQPLRAQEDTLRGKGLCVQGLCGGGGEHQQEVPTWEHAVTAPRNKCHMFSVL